MRLNSHLLLLGNFFAEGDLLESVLELRVEALVRLFLLLDRLLKSFILPLSLSFDVGLQDLISHFQLGDLCPEGLDRLICAVLPLTQPTVGQGLLEEGLVALH